MLMATIEHSLSARAQPSAVLVSARSDLWNADITSFESSSTESAKLDSTYVDDIIVIDVADDKRELTSTAILVSPFGLLRSARIGR